MNITKQQLKDKLKKHLNREPTNDEIENSKTDLNITNQIILDKLDELELRIKKLEP